MLSFCCSFLIHTNTSVKIDFKQPRASPWLIGVIVQVAVSRYDAVKLRLERFLSLKHDVSHVNCLDMCKILYVQL